MGHSQDCGEVGVKCPVGRAPEVTGGSSFATAGPGGVDRGASLDFSANGGVSAALWPRDRGVFVALPGFAAYRGPVPWSIILI